MLHAHCADVGRDPSQITLSSHIQYDPANVGATLESIAALGAEGLDLPDLRARSLQFHPEAGPGPHDAWPLLEAWVEEVANV